MRERVIGNLLAVRFDTASQLRPLHRIVADQEERRGNLQIVQNVEQHRRVNRIGSVVER